MRGLGRHILRAPPQATSHKPYKPTMSSKPITIEMIDLNQTSPYPTLPITKEEVMVALEDAYKTLRPNAEWNDDPEILAAQGKTYVFNGEFYPGEAVAVLEDYSNGFNNRGEFLNPSQRKAANLLNSVMMDGIVHISNEDELSDWMDEFIKSKGHPYSEGELEEDATFKVVVKPRTIKLKLKKLSDLTTNA